MKKIFLSIVLVTVGQIVYAGGYSNWAIPTSVELVSDGVLIHGNYGDPNECGKPNFVFIKRSDPSFNSVLSMALSALNAKKEMRFYSGRCVEVSFHWAGQVINENANGWSVYIR